jgi:hypothetical protein
MKCTLIGLQEQTEENPKHVTELKYMHVLLFENQLEHCKEDKILLQNLSEQIENYYKQLDMTLNHKNTSDNPRNLKKQIENDIQKLHDYIQEYQKGENKSMPSCNRSYTTKQSNNKEEEYIKQVCQFEQDMFNVQFNQCNICHQRRLNFPLKKDGLCVRCKKEATNGHKFTHKNKALPTWVDNTGKVHYTVPLLLRRLSIAEKLLIQKVSPVVPFF